MKAAEFYKHWTSEVRDAWGKLGVEKIGSRGCKWRYPVGEQVLLLWVETNYKYPWSVYGGGNFSLNAYLPREAPANPSKYKEDVADIVPFFDYWEEQHRIQRFDLNRHVYEKLRDIDKDALYREMAAQLDCTPEAARDAQLYETELEIMEMEVEAPSESTVNPPLYYYDLHDVSSWADLFTRALPGVLRGIVEKPEYSFTLGN